MGKYLYTYIFFFLIQRHFAHLLYIKLDHIWAGSYIFIILNKQYYYNIKKNYNSAIIIIINTINNIDR